MRKVIRIDTKTREVSVTPESNEYRALAGRALTSHFVSQEVVPTCDPLGPENKMIFTGMMLTGTTFSMANRLSVGCKSPLTGGIKEANVGGTAAPYLAAHGIKALILENQPSERECNIVVIAADGEVRIEAANELREAGTYKTVEFLHKKFGPKVSAIVIGPAGERGYLNSSIMVTEFGTEAPCRAAARGGVGAVMGSKGIKAIIIEKAAAPCKFPYADQDAFKEASQVVVQSILDKRGVFSSSGTVGLLGATIPSAMAPYRNFSGGKMNEEELEQFNVGKVLERVRSYGGGTGHACQPGCLVKCSNIVNNEAGEFLTAAFEYETVELFGPNCLIYDMDVLLKIDRFCDDFGFDTIELGASLGVYFESGKMEWGDGAGALAMFESFYAGGSLADDFGMGTQRLGEKYGVKNIPAVKGQAMAAYEPRNLKGTGTTYAIATMGADHTCGPSLSRADLAPTGKEGQLDFAVSMQGPIAAADSNACLFCWAAIMAVGADYAKLINAAYGFEWTVGDVIGMGKKAVEAEREFNRLAGITPEQDRLPEFFYTEPSPATGSVYDITHEEILEKWHV